MTDAESELHTGSGSCAAIRANLTGANLTGANLAGANLTRELLSWPYRRGVNFGADKLEGPNFERAFADENTRWPEGLDPVAAGVIFH